LSKKLDWKFNSDVFRSLEDRVLRDYLIRNHSPVFPSLSVSESENMNEKKSVPLFICGRSTLPLDDTLTWHSGSAWRSRKKEKEKKKPEQIAPQRSGDRCCLWMTMDILCVVVVFLNCDYHVWHFITFQYESVLCNNAHFFTQEDLPAVAGFQVAFVWLPL